MKNKILSFLLVITMLATTPLSVLAEDTADKGLDTTSEINIEKNTNIIDSDEGSISEEDLDANKEEIFEPTSPQEEPTQTKEEPKTDSQEPKDNVPEGTPSEDSIESSNNEGTPNENKPIEETPVDTEPVEGDTEGIVEETVEGQPLEEQPLVEQPANTIPVEPQIFFVSEGLTLTREADALTLQGYYPCENIMGVDVRLVAVQVIPLNDWVLVGSEVDFKNSKEGLKECRLTVNGQVIDNTFENGVALIEDQVELLNGSTTEIPVEIEMGPFKESLNDGVLSLVLVFEEIVEEEVQGVVSEEPIDSELGSPPTDEEGINEGNEEGVTEDKDIPKDEEQIEDIPLDTPIPSEPPKPPDIPNTEEENQVHSTEDNSVEVDITQDGVGEIDPTPAE